jgi:hypothetical protein
MLNETENSYNSMSRKESNEKINIRIWDKASIASSRTHSAFFLSFLHSFLPSWYMMMLQILKEMFFFIYKLPHASPHTTTIISTAATWSDKRMAGIFWHYSFTGSCSSKHFFSLIFHSFAYLSLNFRGNNFVFHSHIFIYIFFFFTIRLTCIVYEEFYWALYRLHDT